MEYSASCSGLPRLGPEDGDLQQSLCALLQHTVVTCYSNIQLDTIIYYNIYSVQ